MGTASLLPPHLQPQLLLSLTHWLGQVPGSSHSPTSCSPSHSHCIRPRCSNTSFHLAPALAGWIPSLHPSPLCTLPMSIKHTLLLHPWELPPLYGLPPKIICCVLCFTRLVFTQFSELGVPPQNQEGEVHFTYSKIFLSWAGNVTQSIKALVTKLMFSPREQT